jgi:DNA replication protein DnaC
MELEQQQSILQAAAGRNSGFACMEAVARGTPIELGTRAETCELHGAFDSRGISAKGREAWAACPKCLQAYRDQQEAQRRAEALVAAERRTAARIATAGIPLRFQGKRLPDFRADIEGQVKALSAARAYLEQFDTRGMKGASLVFAGKPGNGKSLLAMIVAQELCRRGYSALYATWQELILEIRRTWGREGEGREWDVIERYATTDLLVLDEIGVTAGSDSEKAMIFNIIDRRYSDMLPTVFVTNLGRKELEAFIGERPYDRLRQTATFVAFQWGSYRETARAEDDKADPLRRPRTPEDDSRHTQLDPWGGVAL